MRELGPAQMRILKVPGASTKSVVPSCVTFLSTRVSSEYTEIRTPLWVTLLASVRLTVNVPSVGCAPDTPRQQI